MLELKTTFSIAFQVGSLKANRMTAQSVTLWTMIITTAEHTIKTAQANITVGTIMLNAVNCVTHLTKNIQDVMKFKKSNKRA